MRTKHLIFILYDSIHNSVFESQVLVPLIHSKKKDPDLTIILITFESTPPKKNLLDRIKQSGIKIIIVARKSFLCKELLFLEIKYLKNILKNFKEYTLTARGPIASYIALNSIGSCCKKFIIQARGLLAEEYAYAHEKAHFYLSIIHKIRKKFYQSLERAIYSTFLIGTKFVQNITIQAVSPALKEYLIKEFHIPAHIISIAYDDIPKLITKNQHAYWRKEIRKKLGIPFNAFVYVYCGSAHVWQCPEEMLNFFLKEFYEKQHLCYLLILSPDLSIFKELISRINIPNNYCYLLSVNHQEVSAYLCAADQGLLFRKPHLINWVSRPTKLLEYQATHLSIQHNNTVNYVVINQS